MAEDYLKSVMDKAKKKKQLEQEESIEKKPVLETEVQKEPKPLEDQKIADVLKELKAVQETKIQTENITPEVPQESEAEKETRKAAEKKILEKYGQTELYTIEGQQIAYYYVPVTRPNAVERTIINTIKEAATRLISITPYRIRDLEQRRTVYKQRILEILEVSPELKIPKGKFEFYAEAVIREMIGYGIIDPLVRDDFLEEIMVIGEKKPVYVFHRKYGMMKTNIEFYSDGEITDLVNRIAREIGRRVDFSAPLLDARLPDGSRVHAAISPAAVSGSSLTIRKFRKDPYSITDLIKFKTINLEAAAFLWTCFEGLQAKPANILISGGTGSGKTTTLNMLCSFVPETERVITIEDTAELSLPLKHWVRLEGRPPSLEGKGEITLDILTKNSLRMRPDRIIVGEVRHDEAFTLFTAMNTGHQGSAGTLHANSARETIIRVTNPPMSVPVTMLSGLDFIVVQQRIHDRRLGAIRRITEIAEITNALEGKPEIQTIFEWNPKTDNLERTDMPCVFLKHLSELSSFSVNDVTNELKQREQFLSELIKKDTHEISTVSKEMQKYLINRLQP
ncbi:MAG: CpaF family protein [Candidatus Diapherotrites archaeon]|nr:CpaF family protein [Candidatus Diapherotrites archaeon]